MAAALADVCQEDAWLREHPVAIEWFGGQYASGQIAVDDDLVRLISGAHQQLRGIPARVEGVPYGSDLRLLVGLAGIPTVHYGPGDVARAHGPNESVPVWQLEATARTLILSILRFCGHESS